MTIQKIIIKEDNKPYFIQDWPEEPNYGDYYWEAHAGTSIPNPDGLYKERMDAHTQAIEQAKQSAIRFNDPEYVLSTIWEHGEMRLTYDGWKEDKLKEDHIFGLPPGHSVKIKTDHLNEECKIECICTYDEDYYAILLPTPKEQISAHSFTEEEFDGSVQYKLEKFGCRIRVNCPDEDDEIHIALKENKQYAGMIFTLNEAEEIANYILGHINNARIANP